MGLLSPSPSKESVPTGRSINICPVNERRKFIQNSPLQEVWISSTIRTSVMKELFHDGLREIPPNPKKPA